MLENRKQNLWIVFFGTGFVPALDQNKYQIKYFTINVRTYFWDTISYKNFMSHKNRVINLIIPDIPGL